VDPIPIAVESMPRLDIADEVIVPRWVGERLDLGAAVDAALSGSERRA
jgi:hypothetical protein